MENKRSPVRILLAEDHYPDVILLREALDSAGVAYELERCINGEDAIARLASHSYEDRPDLIILDLNLPRIGGFEVLEYVRASSVLQSVPVIILTSSTATRDHAEAARLGADAFVSKPTQLGDYVDTVGRTIVQQLGRHRRGSAAGGRTSRHSRAAPHSGSKARRAAAPRP
jgi:CheY-like chemotaxis protein